MEIWINKIMNYLTNYYKNLSDQLQEKVNYLKHQLNEAPLDKIYCECCGQKLPGAGGGSAPSPAPNPPPTPATPPSGGTGSKWLPSPGPFIPGKIPNNPGTPPIRPICVMSRGQLVCPPGVKPPSNP